MSKSVVGKMVIYQCTDEEMETQSKLADQGFCNTQKELPAVIVKDWGGCVNLNVFMDGPGSFWSTSRNAGTNQGEFRFVDVGEEEPETEG